MSISFDLTEEQEALRRLVRRFAVERIAPRAEEFNHKREFPVDLVLEMGELGLFGLPFPEEYGGSGGDYLSFCLALEEIGRIDQSLAITLEAGVGLGAMPIYRFGTQEQRRRWLPPLAAGEQIAGFGLTESGAGSDAASLRTRARQTDGEWVIDGSKQFITNAGTPLSSFVTIAAMTGETPREVTNFIVPTGTPGYTVGSGYRKVGWHASDTRDLSFDGAIVPADHQLGERGRGLANFLSVLDAGRIAIAAVATGSIQGCIDECVRYAGQREAFGRPIGRYQAIAFKIADMAVQAELSRNAYYRAAWLMMQDKPFKRAACVAKLYASEAAVTAAREACQVFGGYGFMTEFPVGRFYQDAKVLEIGEGTSEVQRLLIARDLGLPSPSL